MKTKIWIMALVLLTGMLMSCTTGQYMTLKSSENAEVLGTVQATFNVTGSFRYRKVINNQAYMHLLAAAQKEYQGVIDIRDIRWAIGQSDSANNNYEYTAVGKVIKAP
ncbi:MAG: hypothetical protein FWG99_06500 [Treponema sp.]|nr:hypothetical protein [Treponema sp.]